jgi:hypothetical protein
MVLSSWITKKGVSYQPAGQIKTRSYILYVATVRSAVCDRPHLYQQKKYCQVELTQGDVVAILRLAVLLVVPTEHTA